jgi:hypothetical protein
LRAGRGLRAADFFADLFFGIFAGFQVLDFDLFFGFLFLALHVSYLSFAGSNA